jgi:ABC-type uncharacterized transport system permease subunit
MALTDAVVMAIAAQAVTAAVPLLLAGLGELVAQRAGVLNVGIEGLMLTGCIGGYLGAVLSGSAFVGLLVAVLAGAVLALLFALVTVRLRCDQIVAGMAINLLAVGLSGTAWLVAQGHGYGDLPASAGFARSGLALFGADAAAWLAGLPVLGPLLFAQYGLFHVTVLLALALWWLLRATRAGLILRALGEAPDACAAAGIDVLRWRLLAVVVAGACAGAAGAYLSIMRTHGFTPLMTGGAGFLVLALVIFGRWSVPGLLAGCLLFGALDSLQQHLQGSGLNDVVPYQAFKALPYVVALLALAVLRKANAGPSALGQPWPGRGEP